MKINANAYVVKLTSTSTLYQRLTKNIFRTSFYQKHVCTCQKLSVKPFLEYIPVIRFLACGCYLGNCKNEVVRYISFKFS